jgi:putative copper resistance protein D
MVGGVLIVVAACLAAWALAHPSTPLASALVRTLADVAAVITLGLAVLPMLDVERYRDRLARRDLLAVSAVVWLAAELIRLIVVAADTAGVPVSRIGVGTVAEFARSTTDGRSVMVSVGAAVAVVAVAVAAPRRGTVRKAIPTVTALATGIAAAGLAARTLAGHLAENPVGGIAVAVHALAAALWCGALAAVLLTVDHRGQWARILPRFSQLALWCMVALLVGGVAGAAVAVQSPADLYATGYGRLLLAKIVLTAALASLAWRYRAGWLPAARSHRATAHVSRARSLTELSLMAVALAVAAALAVTG